MDHRGRRRVDVFSFAFHAAPTTARPRARAEVPQREEEHARLAGGGAAVEQDQEHERLREEPEEGGKDYSVLLDGEGRHRTGSLQAGIWKLDTASGRHATGELGLFSGHLSRAKPGSWVHGATGHSLPIHGFGTVQFAHFTLQDVCYVPGLAANLVSYSKLTADGYGITLDKEAGSYIFEEATGKHVCDIRPVGGLFELDSVPVGLHRTPPRT
ncbi:hypothetical protein ACQ4PT_063163 [Festuca glaucescens]